MIRFSILLCMFIVGCGSTSIADEISGDAGVKKIVIIDTFDAGGDAITSNGDAALDR
jgi:hypothetical protein